MMNEAGFRTRGVFEFLAIIFLVALVGIAVYFYQSSERERRAAPPAAQSPPAPAQAQAPPQAVRASSGEIESLIRDKGKLEGELTALKAAQSQFESEKNVILNQVRTSVKAFDDYRQQMASDLKRLNDQIVDLTRENQQLKSSSGTAMPMAMPAVRGNPQTNMEHQSDMASLVRELREEIAVYRETIAILEQEIEAMQDRRILIEAGKLHYNVGNFYFRNKSYQEAVEEYKKALLYQPKDADIHYNLAVVSDEYLGDRKTSLTHYKRYLSLIPPGDESRRIEQRILDLELYETVLAADKDLEMDTNIIRWMEPKHRPSTQLFRVEKQ